MTQFFDNVCFQSDNEQKLYEVVDSNNRPICLLPADIIEAQNLVGRSVACLIQIKKDKWLIDYDMGAGLGFSCFSRLEAPFGPEEFCRLLVRKKWKLAVGKITLLQRYSPCAANKNTWAWVYKVAPANKGALSATCQASAMTLAEINSLFEQNIAGEAFFKFFWNSKKMSRSQK